jgi:pimeloyl-ACP methyl ester carboxylesterase
MRGSPDCVRTPTFSNRSASGPVGSRVTSLRWNPSIDLPGGGAYRVSGPADARDLVVLVPGATSAARAGRWSSNLTWLAPRLRRALGRDVRIVQVRFGRPSWQHLELPVADVRHVLEREAASSAHAGVTAGDRRMVLVGFSMGGAASLANAAAAGVVGLVGLAPWLPVQLPITNLRGRRLRIAHGSLDGELKLIPGVRASSGRDAVARATAAGIDATFTIVPGGLHGVALPAGPVLVPMPRAHAFTAFVVRSVSELLPRTGSSSPAR